MLLQEWVNRAREVRRIHFAGIDVAAADFDECLLAARRVEQAPAFRDRDDGILRAVKKEEGRADALLNIHMHIHLHIHI